MKRITSENSVSISVLNIAYSEEVEGDEHALPSGTAGGTVQGEPGRKVRVTCRSKRKSAKSST